MPSDLPKTEFRSSAQLKHRFEQAAKEKGISVSRWINFAIMRALGEKDPGRKRVQIVVGEDVELDVIRKKDGDR